MMEESHYSKHNTSYGKIELKSIYKDGSLIWVEAEFYPSNVFAKICRKLGFIVKSEVFVGNKTCGEVYEDLSEEFSNEIIKLHLLSEEAKLEYGFNSKFQRALVEMISIMADRS